jgi:hypothetical protein
VRGNARTVVPDHVGDLDRRPLRRLPVREELGHREVQPTLARGPGDEDVGLRLSSAQRGDRRVRGAPLTAWDDQDAPGVRMELPDLRPERGSTARARIRGQDGRDRAAVLRVAPEGLQRGFRRGVLLDLVVGGEPLPQVVRERHA